MHFHNIDPTGLFSKSIYFSLNGIAAAMLLPFADNRNQFKTKFGKAITHISLISYSMYLINLGLIAQVIEKHFIPSTPLIALVTYIIYWSLVIILSTLLYKYFEKPVMDLRDRK